MGGNLPHPPRRAVLAAGGQMRTVSRWACDRRARLDEPLLSRRVHRSPWRHERKSTERLRTARADLLDRSCQAERPHRVYL